jgi:hypothetical protein
MRTLKKHLAGYLKNPKFRKLFKEEKVVINRRLAEDKRKV